MADEGNPAAPAAPAVPANPAPAAPSTPATPAAPAATPSILSVDPAAAPATPATWPDDWRARATGGDDKLNKRLERYGSPEVALKALFAAQDRISKGDIGPKLSDKPTETELKEYREAIGVPEKPEDYKIQLAEGRVVGEFDKPLVDIFLKKMHDTNAKPEYVNAALNAYYELQDQQIAQREQADNEAKTKAEDELRQEMGSDYRRNIQLASSFLATAPNGVADLLINARAPDGSALMNNPDVIRGLVQWAREINPVATVAGIGGPNAGQAISDEIASLEKAMGDTESDYWKGPMATKKQERYRELITARDKISARK